MAVLDASPDTGYVLSEELLIIYCNAAWDRFAREQDGPAAVMSGNVTGKNLMAFIPDDLKGFYHELFAHVRSGANPLGHDYECSSASVFRLFRMQVYPLQRGAGFVVQNSLRVEHPHERIALDHDDVLYRDSNGLICCCRELPAFTPGDGPRGMGLGSCARSTP